MSEFSYFSDPQLDRLVALVWQVTQELQVTRARLLATEDLLVAAGVLPPDAVTHYRPDTEAKRRLDADRQASIDRLVRVLTESDDSAAPLRTLFTQRLAAIGVTPGALGQAATER